MLEMLEPSDACQEKLLTGSRNNSRERCVLQATKLKGIRRDFCIRMGDMGDCGDSVEFAQLFLILLWSSAVSICSFLPFETVCGNVCPVPLYARSM